MDTAAIPSLSRLADLRFLTKEAVVEWPHIKAEQVRQFWPLYIPGKLLELYMYMTLVEN